MKLYYGGYGHHPSGKQYVYYGSDDLRTGQNVVAPVTHYKSGKNYNTMFTIQRTGGFQRNSRDVLQRTMAENEVIRSQNKNINIKTLNENENLSTLAGSKPFNRKQEWKQYSDYVYKEKIKARLTGKQPTILSPEEYRNQNKRPSQPKQKEFKFKGVTLGDVISGKKNIKTPNYKNVGERFVRKLTKGYEPEIKTKRVWNTDTWEYDTKTIMKYPDTAISRLRDNYNVDNFANRMQAKYRLIGE